MHFSIAVIILGVAMVTHAAEPAPKGLHFIGVGYNLLRGNPEGGNLRIGGIDPGLLTTRKIFKLSYDTKKLSVDRKYEVPDQVRFAPRASCVEAESKDVVSGAESYQRELSVDVAASAGYESIMTSFAFSQSERYAEMKKQTSNFHNVFYQEKKVCNKGRVRYLLDAAYRNTAKFPVTEDFASAVCALPENYDKSAYLKFIEKWGTDVVVQVELGEKRTVRFKSSNTEFTKFVMENIASSVSVEGEFLGFSGSFSVDMNMVRNFVKSGAKFGSDKLVCTSGGPDLPEPIGLKLVPIDVALKENFYKSLDQQKWSQCIPLLEKLRLNAKNALKDYPRLKNAKFTEDPAVRIPLTWPEGTYGLPMPKEGCPKEKWWTWHTGTRYQDTEDSDSNNDWSSHFNLAWDNKRNDVVMKYCIKTNFKGAGYPLPWPKGDYCIHKKGRCPEGFTEGWINWDDEDTNNINKYSGTLPEGNYGRNTKMYFCCRSDGFPTNAIALPTASPFVLMKFGYQCQHVHGMKVTEEFFGWDCEDSNTDNPYGGTIPAGHVEKRGNIKIFYCYYYPN